MCSMTSSGSPYARFRRALAIGRLPLVLAAAAELGHVGLGDALDVLVLIAREDPERYPRAAARFMQRLASERTLTLEEHRLALAIIDLLPVDQRAAEAIRALAA